MLKVPLRIVRTRTCWPDPFFSVPMRTTVTPGGTPGRVLGYEILKLPSVSTLPTCLPSLKILESRTVNERRQLLTSQFSPAVAVTKASGGGAGKAVGA